MNCKEYTVADIGGRRASDMEFAKRMDRFGAGIFLRLAETKKEKTTKGGEVVGLSIGAPNIPPTSYIMKTLCRTATELSSYMYTVSDRRGLLEVVRGWYNIRYGVELDSETEICSFLGSREGLARIALSIVDEGGVVLVSDPCYPVFGNGPQIAGARFHYMPQRKEDGYIVRLGEIPGDVARKAKLMVVSYPNNPTTVMAPNSFYKELIDFARRYDIIVLHDNAYGDLVFDGRECGSFLRFPGVKEIGVEFNSLSETYGPVGARTGFCLDNSQVVSHLKLFKSNMDHGVFLPMQATAIAAVTEDQSCVQVARQTYETRRNIMCDGFTSIGQKMEQPEVTIFVWAAIPEHYTTSEMSVIGLVERAGVMVTPGNAFGSSGEGCARLALIQGEKMLNKVIRAIRESGVLLGERKR